MQLQDVPDQFFDPDQISQDELMPDTCQDNVLITSERYITTYY